MEYFFVSPCIHPSCCPAVSSSAWLSREKNSGVKIVRLARTTGQAGKVGRPDISAARSCRASAVRTPGQRSVQGREDDLSGENETSHRFYSTGIFWNL